MSDSPQSAQRPTLLRVLGLVFGLAVVIGGMIGSGIMRAPGVVAQGITSGPLTLAVWALLGGMAMLTAMPLVEAGSSLPIAGGAYAIADRAFGRATGIFAGWLSWLQLTASNAFISVVFGEYVHRLGFAAGLSTGVLAVGLIIAVGGINWIGTRVSGASQSLASAIKGAAFVVLAVILFASPHAATAVMPPPAHLAGVTTLGAFVMAIRVIYQTYAGWDTGIMFSEEVSRPEKNVARSTFWGIGLVTVLYVVMNAAVLHVLNPSAIAGSALAVGDAVKVSLGPVGDTVITAIGLFSLSAIVNLQTMGAARITFGMARDGVLPTALAKVAKGGAPRRSVLAVTLVAALFAATGSYEGIVRIYAPWSMGAILVICICAIRLRIIEPELARPWRMPLFPWIAILACAVQAGLIGVVMWDDPRAALLSILVGFAPLLVMSIWWLFTNLRRA